mgnify:CR=1 FL=1|tara:strand:+ start:71522 stop:71860 length:339 start_codon:yes stop_codon:yes gene_type:complete
MTPKDDDDDLIGFRDFIDGEDKKPKPSPKRRDANSGGFELLTFLENESKRLDKHTGFYEEKVYMLKNFPQGKALNFELDRDIEAQLDILAKMLLKNQSPLCMSLNEILKQFK